MANRIVVAGDGAEVRILPDAAAVRDYAIGLIENRLSGAVGQRGRATMVLSGGGTPQPVYQGLSRDEGTDAVEWLLGDERLTDDGRVERNASSNSRMIEETLFDRLKIPEPRRHLPRAGIDAEAACRDYEAAVGEVLASDADGLFDLVLLGLGTDGHTASLFPGVARPQTEDLVVLGTAPETPRRRLSLSVQALNRTRLIAFLATGEGKAEMVRRVVLDGFDERLPATWISPGNGRLLWVLDSDAAAGLG